MHTIPATDSPVSPGYVQRSGLFATTLGVLESTWLDGPHRVTHGPSGEYAWYVIFSSLHRCIAALSYEPTYIWHWLTAGMTLALDASTLMWLDLLPHQRGNVMAICDTQEHRHNGTMPHTDMHAHTHTEHSAGQVAYALLTPIALV